VTTFADSWRCLVCDAHGDGARSDLEARKHGDATKHGTTTVSTVAP
jgi:hypothetical protein